MGEPREGDAEAETQRAQGALPVDPAAPPACPAVRPGNTWPLSPLPLSERRRELRTYFAPFMALAVMCLGGMRLRINPGGPFAYFSTDILPGISIVLLFLWWRRLPRELRAARVVTVGTLWILTAYWAYGLIPLVTFASRPYARGQWIRW